jgi:hypothetical protein
LQGKYCIGDGQDVFPFIVSGNDYNFLQSKGGVGATKVQKDNGSKTLNYSTDSTILL